MVAAIRPLGVVHRPPRNDQRGGHVIGDAIALGELPRADHRGVGGVALEDLDAPVVRPRLDVAEHARIGERGKHAAMARAAALELRPLGREVEALDGERLALLGGERHQHLDRLADAHLGLLARAAVEHERNPPSGDRVAVAVGGRHGDVVGVDIDADDAEALVGLPLDRRRLGRDEQPPAFVITLEAVADGAALLERILQVLGAVGERRLEGQILAAARNDQGIGQPQPESEAIAAEVPSLAALAARRLVLGAEDKEFARSGLVPVGAPVRVRAVAVRLELELRAEALARAEADTGLPGGVVGLVAGEPVPFGLQSALLVMELIRQFVPLLRLRLVLEPALELREDALRLLDGFAPARDPFLAPRPVRVDRALDLGPDRVELPGGDAVALVVSGFQRGDPLAPRPVREQVPLDPAEQIRVGVEQRGLVALQALEAGLVGALRSSGLLPRHPPRDPHRLGWPCGRGCAPSVARTNGRRKRT